ncbi:VanZ family protein [Bacillus cereus]
MIYIPFAFIAIPLILIWVLYRINIMKKSKSFNKPKELFISLFFIYFLMVINLTLFKQAALTLKFDGAINVNLIPFVKTIKMFKNDFTGIGNALYNVVGNILLFIPLGLFVPLLFKNENKLYKIALYGFVFSLLIEVLQLLTPSNLTDIDDIIFNTLGAVIGYFLYNICIKILHKTKFANIVDKITTDYNSNFLILSLKLLIPVILISVTTIYSALYSSTISGKSSNEDIAKKLFPTYVSDGYVYSAEFSDYKFFLTKNGNYIDLLTAKKVLNNRWTQNDEAFSLDLSNKDYGYSIKKLFGNNYENLGIVLFGKNFDAESIEITFYGKKYSQELTPNDYFIVPFLTFERYSKNIDINNIFMGKESKDLIESIS